jgi:hypothetical protein
MDTLEGVDPRKPLRELERPPAGSDDADEPPART